VRDQFYPPCARLQISQHRLQNPLHRLHIVELTLSINTNIIVFYLETNMELVAFNIVMTVFLLAAALVDQF